MEITMERRGVGLQAILLGPIFVRISSQKSSTTTKSAVCLTNCPQEYYGVGLPGRLR